MPPYDVFRETSQPHLWLASLQRCLQLYRKSSDKAKGTAASNLHYKSFTRRTQQQATICYTLIMYAAVDIGGTKTLVAVLNNDGVIQQSERFPTPKNYDEFIPQLQKNVAMFTTQDFIAAGVGVAATHLNRKEGVGEDFSNIRTWHHEHIQADIEALLHCPVVVENDAKMAGLSEAMLLPDFSKVLYLTVSTGIGYALIVDRIIDPNIGDGGGRVMRFEHHGKLMPWEDFASGRAIVERFGKRAADIDDPDTWAIIANDISVGLIELIAVTEPDVVVFGGGVGTYFSKYEKQLTEALEKRKTPLLNLPKLRAAQRPEEAVVYGCYDLAKATYGRPADKITG